MKILLARIDDRLIHGQVTVGWCQRLRPGRIVVANDEIAADAWQSRVYASSVPPEIAVSILSREEAVAACGPAAAGREDAESVLLLTASADDMLTLCRSGLLVGTVNIGGMHYRKGKHEMLDFVYVDAADLLALRGLLERGLRLSARQLPGGSEILIDEGMIDRMEARL